MRSSCEQRPTRIKKQEMRKLDDEWFDFIAADDNVGEAVVTEILEMTEAFGRLLKPRFP